MIGRAALALGLLALSAAPTAAAPPRAMGGVRPVEAAETAPATLVAEVIGVSRLDGQGYLAVFRVETPLSGPIERGAEVSVGWEELAPGRAPRFAVGERFLLSLERLPGASIWRERLPDAALRSRTLTPAMRGDAFVASPALATVDRLQHYLALAPADRDGAQGVGNLVDLVALGPMPIAEDAVRRLATRRDLDAKLGARGGERLVAAMLRPDASQALADSLAELAGGQQLESMRTPLEALSRREPPPPAAVFAALARLQGGLSAQRTAELLEGAPAPQREVAVRWVRGPQADATLTRALRLDPDPAVRIAAADRLLELRGADALDPLLLGLSDPEPGVRGAAARGLGSLGDDAVHALRGVVNGNDPRAAQAAVAALGLAGTGEARVALLEIAENHPDRALRGLASVALGRPAGHRH